MRVIRLDTVDSTMLEARREIDAGATAPFAVIAREQSGGVGRLGRKWHSPAGGVWLTYATPLDGPLHPHTSLRTAYVVFLACVQAAQPNWPEAERPLAVKWPNDILFGSAADAPKVAGVLIQVIPKGGKAWALCGVGVNFSNSTSLLPLAAGERAAASLQTVRGSSFSAGEFDTFAGTLLGMLEGAVASENDEPRLLDSDYVEGVKGALWGVGLTVPITLPDGAKVAGRIEGLNDNGCLMVTINGEARELHSVDSIG